MGGGGATKGVAVSPNFSFWREHGEWGDQCQWFVVLDKRLDSFVLKPVVARRSFYKHDLLCPSIRTEQARFRASRLQTHSRRTKARTKSINCGFWATKQSTFWVTTPLHPPTTFTHKHTLPCRSPSPPTTD